MQMELVIGFGIMRNIKTMIKMRKYKVEFDFKDGSSVSYIGTGTPRMSLTEYYVLSPDGKEIVVLKENVRSFVISAYEE